MGALMSVWVCIPSKRPVPIVAKWAEAWRAQGYRIALWRDSIEEEFSSMISHSCDKLQAAPYPGYAIATNRLIQWIAQSQPEARWFVIGGDDVYPDPNHTAEEIAQQCGDYFARNEWKAADGQHCTFGVMQPTGDRWGDSERTRAMYGEDRGAYIDRIAGSAWIGREFARRAYGGNGPLWHEYAHMYSDEELCCVAEKLGVYWRRRDLNQHHEHWMRGENRTKDDMPEFLKEANSPEHWDKYGNLFRDRKEAGFPGSECSA